MIVITYHYNSREITLYRPQGKGNDEDVAFPSRQEVITGISIFSIHNAVHRCVYSDQALMYYNNKTNLKLKIVYYSRKR